MLKLIPMFFPYFHVVRNALTSYLITIFALFFPFLNSIKAVVANDIEGMREFLTYWCVLIVITYVEQLLRLLNWSKNNQYPPEIQLIVILWLTLPQVFLHSLPSSLTYSLAYYISLVSRCLSNICINH